MFSLQTTTTENDLENPLFDDDDLLASDCTVDVHAFFSLQIFSNEMIEVKKMKHKRPSKKTRSSKTHFRQVVRHNWTDIQRNRTHAEPE